ncbi:MAG: glycosyltransferase [Nitrospirae bacterium]|nr:glycosyltransferase [Nitrospirota bacterium]
MYKGHITYDMPFLTQVRHFLSFSATSFYTDKIRMICVNPLLNHVEALGVALTQQQGNHQRRRLFHWIVWKVLGFMGLLSEISIIGCFLVAYLFKVRRRFDVFIGQGPIEVFVGYILQRFGRVRLLVYDDMDYAPGYSPHSIRRVILKHLERYLIKKSDLVISIGAFLAETRKKETGREVIIIPNGVDYELFQRAQEKIPHPPTLLYMGFVEEWSGLDMVMEALSKLVKDFPGSRLFILGHTTPQYLRKLEKLADELAIKEAVFYKGNKTHVDLINYLKEADIGLAMFRPIDLRKYAFSLKVVEYMAGGLPVVTTSGTQSASVVEQYHCGIAVPYEVNALYQALLSMLSDQKLYQHLSENAKHYSRDFRWQDLMDRTYNAIQSSYAAKYT